jgi:hypothetical protein
VRNILKYPDEPAWRARVRLRLGRPVTTIRRGGEGAFGAL